MHQAALRYLGRYAASSASVRKVLDRRVLKYATADGVDLETARGWIDAIIARLSRAGLLDDSEFAANRVRILFERGLPARMIRVKLAEKGIGRDLADQALAALLDGVEDPDYIAALRYAKRRRLGPYRHREADENQRRRELAALARAGFGYDVANRVLRGQGDGDDREGG